MSHASEACHRDIAEGCQAMVVGVVTFLVDSIVPYEAARCIVTVEDIVEVQAKCYLLDAQSLLHSTGVVEAEVALRVAWK